MPLPRFIIESTKLTGFGGVARKVQEKRLTMANLDSCAVVDANEGSESVVSRCSIDTKWAI